MILRKPKLNLKRPSIIKPEWKLLEGIKMKKPTKNHRPALWEDLEYHGRIYAMDDDNNIEIFFFDWNKAIEFSCLNDNSRDRRKFIFNEDLKKDYSNIIGLPVCSMVWWILKIES